MDYSAGAPIENERMEEMEKVHLWFSDSRNGGKGIDYN